MSAAEVRIPVPPRAARAAAGPSMIDVRFCDGPAALERTLAGAQHVAVVEDPAELVSVDERSLDAVVLAKRRTASHARGRLLGEVGRVLRSGGRLVIMAPVAV